MRIHAGHVHRGLDDLVRGESAYREAAEFAGTLDDPDGAADAWERLAELLARHPGRTAEARDAALEAEAGGRRARMTTTNRSPQSRTTCAPWVGTTPALAEAGASTSAAAASEVREPRAPCAVRSPSSEVRRLFRVVFGLQIAF